MKQGSNGQEDFQAVESALRSILQPYEAHLMPASSPSMGYLMNTRHIMPNKQPLFFAGIQPQKNYVSFYLMPVYVFPDLLSGISDALRKRMQGKSCFNFRQLDPALFEELKALTRAGYERYKTAGYV